MHDRHTVTGAGDRPEVKIREVIRPGDLALAAGQTISQVLDEARDVLDAACIDQVCGEVVFKGDDGKFYVGSTEFVIAEADPEYIREILDEDAPDGTRDKVR